MKTDLYAQVINGLKAELRGASERNQAKTLNRMGILHARFGEDRLAEDSFREAMEIAPRSVSSYINIANLKLIQDKPDDALVFLEQGKAIRDTSVVINALLAKTYYQIGDRDKAKDHYRIVEERSPKMAEPMAYIGGDTGAARAADAGSTESLFWDIEEE